MLGRHTGMEAFADRARRELMATGEKVRKRRPETRDELTPQEEQIARLARDGLFNPEIAAQLFISAMKVEWRLGKVFTKLRIGSRRELRTALPGRIRSVVADVRRLDATIAPAASAPRWCSRERTRVATAARPPGYEPGRSPGATDDATEDSAMHDTSRRASTDGRRPTARRGGRHVRNRTDDHGSIRV